MPVRTHRGSDLVCGSSTEVEEGDQSQDRSFLLAVVITAVSGDTTAAGTAAFVAGVDVSVAV